MIKSKSPADLCLNKWTRFFFISLIHNPKITCNILTKAVPSTSYENLERMSRKHGHQGAQLHFEETLRSCFHSSKVRLIREGFVHNTEFMDICHIWRSEEQRKTHELYKKKKGGVLPFSSRLPCELLNITSNQFPATKRTSRRNATQKPFMTLSTRWKIHTWVTVIQN